MERNKLARYVAYGIIVYIVIFISWWTVLLIETEAENKKLKSTIINLEQNATPQTTEYIQSEFDKNKLMIILEGFVFLILLFSASYYVLRILKKQEKFNGLKRNFLLATTHEFNTPLASLKLNLQTLKNPSISETNQQLLFNNSLAEINRLHQLTNNILLTNKMDASEYEFASEKINFSALSNSVIAQFAEQAERINANIQPDVFVLADEPALRIGIMNLIDNALKYSSEEELVTVNLSVQNKQAICEVIDQGIGINSSEQQKIWERFYRVQDERVRTTKGTGLGLYLVKSMVQLNKGEISLKDNVPKGSIFTIQLPLYNE